MSVSDRHGRSTHACMHLTLTKIVDLILGHMRVTFYERDSSRTFVAADIQGRMTTAAREQPMQLGATPLVYQQQKQAIGTKKNTH